MYLLCSFSDPQFVYLPADEPRIRSGSLILSLSVYLDMCLYFCLFVCLPVCLFFCMFVCLSVCLFACLFVCQPLYLPVFLWVSPTFSLLLFLTCSLCLSVCLSLSAYYKSVCLALHLPISLCPSVRLLIIIEIHFQLLSKCFSFVFFSIKVP